MTAADHPARDGRAPLRLILDTNIALDLMFFHDPSCDALDQCLQSGHAHWIGCQPAYDEFLRVLDYPQLARYPGHAELKQAAATAFLARCQLIAPVLPENERTALPRCADPDDQLFLELAVAAQADALLSKDKAVLALSRRTGKRYPKLTICTPQRFFAQSAPAEPTISPP